MRAGIPTHSLARFEAEREAQERRDRLLGRLAVVGLMLLIAFVVGFWLAIGFVAMHLLGKAW